MPQSALKGFPSGSVLVKDASDADFVNGHHQEVSIDMSGVRPGPSQFQQQAVLTVEDDTFVQERAETMQSIESTIVELGSIFQQLAHMVKEQEESIRRFVSFVVFILWCSITIYNW
jgi:syntaxin 5